MSCLLAWTRRLDRQQYGDNASLSCSFDKWSPPQKRSKAALTVTLKLGYEEHSFLIAALVGSVNPSMPCHSPMIPTTPTT
jgi:hypothetical protein